MLPRSITIFTDGSSRGNPGPGGYAAIVIFPDSNDKRGELEVPSGKFQVKEIGGGEKHTTNNRMELVAVIQALSFVSTLHPTSYTLLIFSDSSYVINGITRWVFGWQKNGWRTAAKKEVENRDLWEKLLNLAIYRKIEWKLVGGHIGVAGNERCDEIATAFADGGSPKLYNGPLSGYPIKNILDVSADDGKTGDKAVAQAHARAAAYSYVSKVGGVIQTHRTWADCERRVKGAAGVRYKKVLSAEEEAATIALWRSR